MVNDAMKDVLSIVVPAYNEELNLRQCINNLITVVSKEHGIPCEIIIVNDNSDDKTADVIRALSDAYPLIRSVTRDPPGGFGRAIRSGIEAVQGDVVVIYMADESDHPEDVVAYYNKLQEGYDCVYGSRFMRGSEVDKYPIVKLIVNRIVNRCIQLMFWTRFNDLTNAFKAYRMEVIDDCGPYHASHFNITLEMSLGALIRRYHIAQIPIRWSGRTWGSSNLRLAEMGRRYLSTVLTIFFQRYLIGDDVLAERLRHNRRYRNSLRHIERRVRRLEEQVERTSSTDESSHFTNPR